MCYTGDCKYEDWNGACQRGDKTDGRCYVDDCAYCECQHLVENLTLIAGEYICEDCQEKRKELDNE